MKAHPSVLRHLHPSHPSSRRRVCRLVAFCSALWVEVAPVEAGFEIDDPSSFLLPFATPLSIGSNPAGLPGPECWRWHLGHQVPFGLRELGAHHFATAVSGRRWGVGSGFSLRGPDRYRETAAWLGCGVGATSSLTVGAAVHYLQVSGMDLSTSGAAGFSGGLRLQLTPAVEIDAWYRAAVDDLARPRLHLRVLHFLGQESTAQAWLSRQGHRRTPGSTQPARLDLAAGGRVHQQLWLFLGTRSDPRQFAAGGRVTAGRQFFDYRVHSHAALGASHSAIIGRSCERR